jgi:hypothetical protein
MDYMDDVNTIDFNNVWHTKWAIKVQGEGHSMAKILTEFKDSSLTGTHPKHVFRC